MFPSFQDGQWAELTTPGSPSYHPLWAPVLILEIVGNLFFFGFAIVLLVLMFRKHHLLPKLMVVFYLLNVLYVGGDLALANQIPAVANQHDPKAFQDVSRAVVAACIWIPYFLVSVRVKNTFVKESSRENDDFDEDRRDGELSDRRRDDDRPGIADSTSDQYR